jgi:hypothetical protein
VATGEARIGAGTRKLFLLNRMRTITNRIDVAASAKNARMAMVRDAVADE